jgi:hypothetical protein
VHLVLKFVGCESPRILEGFVCEAFFKKTHASSLTNTPWTMRPLRSLISAYAS